MVHTHTPVFSATENGNESDDGENEGTDLQWEMSNMRKDVLATFPKSHTPHRVPDII